MRVSAKKLRKVRRLTWEELTRRGDELALLEKKRREHEPAGERRDPRKGERSKR